MSLFANLNVKNRVEDEDFNGKVYPKLKIAEADTISVAISKDANFGEASLFYMEDLGYIRCCGDDAIIAEKIKIAEPYIALAVYHIVAREIQVIMAKKTSVGKATSILGAISEKYNPLEAGSNVYEITRSGVDGYTYTCEVVNDYLGVENGHQRIEQHTGLVDPNSLFDGLVIDMTLEQIVRLKPEFETKYAILKAKAA